MTIPAPPVGALVRHTTRYTDGTTITMEGRVSATRAPNPSVPVVLIGAEAFVGYLNRPDRAESVDLEVIEVPEAEPPHSTVFSNGIDAWIRLDSEGDPEGRWYVTGVEEFRRWAYVAEHVKATGWQKLHRMVPDPADDAPALPCTIPTRWAGRQLLVEGADADGYIPLFTTEEPVTGRSARLTADGARLAASALLRAAREVEQP